jgi:hypothetical protein
MKAYYLYLLLRGQSESWVKVVGGRVTRQESPPLPLRFLEKIKIGKKKKS